MICDKIKTTGILSKTDATIIQTVDTMSKNFISDKIPDNWSYNIREKVISIIEKEVLPLLIPNNKSPNIQQQIELTVDKIGRILSIGYLADYALESDLTFDVHNASEELKNIVSSIGLDVSIIEIMISLLTQFYYLEKQHDNRITDDYLLKRYWLKGIDVVLVQLTALYGIGRTVRREEIQALHNASSILDIIDDLQDIEEDIGNPNGNPFVTSYFYEKGNITPLFHKLINRYSPSLIKYCNFLKGDPLIKNYCNNVLDRLKLQESMLS